MGQKLPSLQLDAVLLRARPQEKELTLRASASRPLMQTPLPPTWNLTGGTPRGHVPRMRFGGCHANWGVGLEQAGIPGPPKSAKVSAFLEKGAFLQLAAFLVSLAAFFSKSSSVQNRQQEIGGIRREIGGISRKQVSACRSVCCVSACFLSGGVFWAFRRKFLPPGPFGRKFCRRRVQVWPRQLEALNAEIGPGPIWHPRFGGLGLGTWANLWPLIGGVKTLRLCCPLVFHKGHGSPTTSRSKKGANDAFGIIRAEPASRAGPARDAHYWPQPPRCELSRAFQRRAKAAACVEGLRQDAPISWNPVSKTTAFARSCDHRHSAILSTFHVCPPKLPTPMPCAGELGPSAGRQLGVTSDSSHRAWARLARIARCGALTPARPTST